MTYWRLSIYEDIEPIASNMREADVKEVLAATGDSPFTALFNGLMRSDPCYTLIDAKGNPGAMLGIVPETDRYGLIWLLGTDAIAKNTYPFLKYSRPFLERLWEESGKELLYNYTHVDNTLHHRWLKWLGFTFLNRFGPFYEFAKLRGS